MRRTPGALPRGTDSARRTPPVSIWRLPYRGLSTARSCASRGSTSPTGRPTGAVARASFGSRRCRCGSLNAAHSQTAPDRPSTTHAATLALTASSIGVRGATAAPPCSATRHRPIATSTISTATSTRTPTRTASISIGPNRRPTTARWSRATATTSTGFRPARCATASCATGPATAAQTASRRPPSSRTPSSTARGRQPTPARRAPHA